MGGGGSAQKVSTLKGSKTVLACPGGGGGSKCFGPTIFPFCSTPLLTVISELSLNTAKVPEG